MLIKHLGLYYNMSYDTLFGLYNRNYGIYSNKKVIFANDILTTIENICSQR